MYLSAQTLTLNATAPNIVRSLLMFRRCCTEPTPEFDLKLRFASILTRGTRHLNNKNGVWARRMEIAMDEDLMVLERSILTTLDSIGNKKKS